MFIIAWRPPVFSRNLCFSDALTQRAPEDILPYILMRCLLLRKYCLSGVCSFLGGNYNELIEIGPLAMAETPVNKIQEIVSDVLSIKNLFAPVDEAAGVNLSPQYAKMGEKKVLSCGAALKMGDADDHA
jgi:hypothetical protein